MCCSTWLLIQISQIVGIWRKRALHSIGVILFWINSTNVLNNLSHRLSLNFKFDNRRSGRVEPKPGPRPSDPPVIVAALIIILAAPSHLVFSRVALTRGETLQRTKSDRSHDDFSVAVVVAFFICWAPFHAQRLFAIFGSSTFDPDSQLLHQLYNIATYVSGVLYYVSTTINPILYHIMSLKFRSAFKVCIEPSAWPRTRAAVILYGRTGLSGASREPLGWSGLFMFLLCTRGGAYITPSTVLFIPVFTISVCIWRVGLTKETSSKRLLWKILNKTRVRDVRSKHFLQRLWTLTNSVFTIFRFIFSRLFCFYCFPLEKKNCNTPRRS